MKTYRSPIYPALMIRLPGDGRRSVKASGGYFNVEDDDVEAFEKVIAARPEYRIAPVDGNGNVTIPADAAGVSTFGLETARSVKQPEPVSEIEVHPEMASEPIDLDKLNVPELRERLEGLGLDSTGRKAVLVERLQAASDEASRETTEEVEKLNEDADESDDESDDEDGDAE